MKGVKLKHVVFLLALGASMWALPASAQLKPSTRDVCESRCNKMEFEENPKTVQYQAHMAQLRYEMKRETDPDKRKLMEDEVQRAMEKREEFVEKMCRHICRHNPER